MKESFRGKIWIGWPWVGVDAGAKKKDEDEKTAEEVVDATSLKKWPVEMRE